MDADEQDSASPRGWSPSTRIRSEVVPPCSKSQALRVLLAASLAEGETRILGLSSASDVRAAIACSRALGARVRGEASEGDLAADMKDVSVERETPSTRQEPRHLDAGESGTLARLVTASCALSLPPRTLCEISVRGTLLRRTSSGLVEALRQAGAELRGGEGSGTWPLTVRSTAPPTRVAIARPTSSQEVSALLFALSSSGSSHELCVEGPIPSRPYLDMTLRVLASFGVEVDERGEGELFLVRGPLRAPELPVRLEPDASAAAVALAAACLAGGETLVRGFDEPSLQGDVWIVDALAAFGCRTSAERGVLQAAGRPTRGATLDLQRSPDLAPVLAAVAGAVALRGGADSDSRLEGLATLQGKESARITVLAQALAALGLSVRASEDSLEVSPGRATNEPLALDPRGDHRMAFAFALLGLVRPGLEVLDPGCVAKSWPEFWEACVQPPHPENREPA